MKVVGNCPQCGNPIYGDPAVQSVKRTCFCVLPLRTQPIQISPIQIVPQPHYPYWTNLGGVTNVATTSTGYTTIPGQTAPPKDPPPDADAGMVT